MRLEAYLDQVTKGKVRDVSRLNLPVLEAALEEINRRPMLAERSALLVALEQRFAAFGRNKGWVPGQSEKKQTETVNGVVGFLLFDVIQVQKTTAEDIVINEFKSELEKFVKQALNSREKEWLAYGQILLKLVQCENEEDLRKVLTNVTLTSLGAWTAKNWPNLVQKLKWVKVQLRVRNRIIKYIALRVEWGATMAGRFGPL